MTPIEEQIINFLKLEKKARSLEIVSKIKYLMRDLAQGPFGISSEEFINSSLLNTFVLKDFKEDNIVLWFRIEDYLITTKNNSFLSQEKLKSVEEVLNRCLKEITSEAKSRGTAMLPKAIANPEFMKNLYSVNDEHLSHLFLKYLPAPRANIFSKQSIPHIIAKREQETFQTITQVLTRNQKRENKFSALEKGIVRVQRNFRAKKRKQEEFLRVPFLHPYMTTEDTEQLLDDANKPYIPQCEDPQLAKRIISAAKKVELFSTVKHLTAPSALENIFNDAIYARRTLLQFYLPFKPASFDKFFDHAQGDANTICLGVNEIDPHANQGIELQFDAKKISKNNPCVFYKQRDFGYIPEKIREVNIGDLTLFFSQTPKLRIVGGKGFTSFQLYWPTEEYTSDLYHTKEGKMYILGSIAEVQNALLIAYDLEKMHQILVLNFFRFIDRLDDINNNKEDITKQKIYAALSKLGEKELIATLQQIGVQITDTMEFNFYGAYKIDFSALLTIKITTDEPYILNLPTFVNELKTGNIKKLDEVKQKIPELFNSYRFIDYLLSQLPKTMNESVIAELDEQRKKCFLPSWMESKV